MTIGPSQPIWVGADQDLFVALRGRGPTPVLLIHGGPGSSLLPFARTIARSTTLERDHTLAYWEQRGTGRSRGHFAESDLSLEGALEDAAAVAEHLADRHGQRLVVLGHSWGTVLGTLLARRRPDLVRSYIGVGQVVNVREQERRSTAWARAKAEVAHDRSALRTLDRIGPLPHSAAGMLRQRSVLARYGGVWYGHGYRTLVASGLRDYLATPEYTPLDLWRQARDPAFSLRALMPDKLEVDLVRDVPILEVSATFVCGVHDQITPIGLVESFAASLDAPSVRVVRFRASAHLPFLSEPGRFEAVVRDVSGG